MVAQWVCRLVLDVVLVTTVASLSVSRADESAAIGDDATVLRDYLSGNGLLNRGLHELAAAEYRKFLDQHPEHAKAPIARYGLAVCLFRLGRLDEATRELSALPERADFEFAPEGKLLLGQCHLALGKYAAAEDVLTKWVESWPDHALAPDATVALIEALQRNGKHETVVEQAKTFIERWPKHAARDRVTLLWGLSLQARQDWPAAAGRFAEVLKKAPTGPLAEQADLSLAQCHAQRGALDEAERLYRAIAARKDGPNTPDALLALAAIALRKDAPADALPWLDRALSLVTEGPQRCTAALLRARAALAMNQPDEALTVLGREQPPCDASADQFAYWLAKATLRKGDLADGSAQLERALAKYPRSTLHAEMSLDRGATLAERGDDEAAARVLQEFLDENPKHELAPDALYLLATCQHRLKNYVDSSALCRRLLNDFAQHRLAAPTTLLAAENLLLDGKDAEAAAAYQQFLEHYPHETQVPTAQLRLGIALARLGRLDDAISPLSAAAAQVEKSPQLRESLLILGDLYLQRSEWKQAETWLTKYLGTAGQQPDGSNSADPPATDEALLKLGIAQHRQGEDAAALTAFEKLFAKFPDSPLKSRADLERGAIASQKNDYRGAADRFAAAYEAAQDDGTAAMALDQQGQALLAAEHYPEAERVFSRFIERFPTHELKPRAQARLALALARQDKPAEALSAIEQSQQDASALDESLKCSLGYEKAWCLRKLGKTQEALAAYRALLKDGAGPQRALVSIELAELLAAGGQCEEAVRLLDGLRKPADEFEKLPAELRTRTLYRAGTCAFDAGDFAAAIAALEPLLTAPTQTDVAASALYFCGEANFKLGRHAQAVECFSRVVEEKEPRDAYGPSLLRLGDCQAALGNWSKAEQAFDKYLRELPASEQWHQAQFGLGWARENLGRHDEALTAYRALVERHHGPTAARAQFQIGECLYAQKKYAAAVTELLKVDILYSFPEWSAAALYEAGRCFDELGKNAEARQQYEAVRTKYGDTRWATLASQRLAARPEPLPGKGGT